MTSTSRSLQNTWNTAWETAPPAACQTLHNQNNTVAWGYMCVQRQESSDPLPFQINTACMPWVTANVYPSTSAFYSPATACPSSWAAVETKTAGGAGDQWIDGETATYCCPEGFMGDGGIGCRPGSQGVWPVVECDPEDPDDNEFRNYTAVAWPATATPAITALQLRHQASDLASSSGGGLSSGAIAAIATVISLVFVIGALAAFLLWRRKKRRNQDRLESTKLEHASGTGKSSTLGKYTPVSTAAYFAPGDTTPHNGQHEIPEWNAELEASDARQSRLSNAHEAPDTSPATVNSSRSNMVPPGIPRKPIAPTEIDGIPLIPEVGDAYLPYRAS